MNISPQVNHSSPVAADIVLVSDEDPLELGFDARRWEWVPGQVLEPIPLSIDRTVKGGVVFVYYLTPGAHRAAIPLCKAVLISLGEEDFTVDTVDRK